MAGKIRLLTDEVIGKIAAGEVVERPSAAIKELVENSLDAGATAVTVEIREGGVSYFRVTDNGSGIQQSEIRMAFERHATSKIDKAADLASISTLGFRGEALASIAAVSKVTCTTRTRNDVSGVRVTNEGGVITNIEETACPEGTTFVVRELFYNTPVRLKFLKKPSQEASFVSDLMMRLILSRPDVSFRYISNGKTLYHSAGDGKMESAVFSIYGSEMTHSMRVVDGFGGGVLIKGYVGIGDGSRGNRGHQSFFINGRYMRSGVLSAAVEAACRERVMIGRFPTCVLHLTMPFDTVDVNVHPNKLEVRFQNESAVADAVMHAVLDALVERDALQRPAQMQFGPEEKHPTLPVKVTKQESVPDAPVKAQPAVTKVAPVAPAPQPAAKAPFIPPQSAPVMRDSSDALPASRPVHVERVQIIPPEKPKAPIPVYRAPSVQEKPVKTPPAPMAEPEQTPSFLPEAKKPMRLIGTVFNTYILVEYDDHLLMIDQHAVHERLMFDRLMKAYDQHAMAQELLIPMVLSATPREQALLEENRELLEKLGLTVEAFGENEIAVRSIPMVLGQPQAADFVRDIIDQLQGERGVVTMEKRRSAILQIACKKAVKGGDALSEDELRHLVTRMVDDRVTPTCPHGRPLVVALSHQELDKRFKRIQ